MKEYKLNIINNFKRGFLTIPFGVVIIGFLYAAFIADIELWLKLFLILLFGSIGLPGIIIHLFYVLHDMNIEILYNPRNDYFEYKRNGQTTKILKSEIESIEKIHRDIPKVLWWGYKKFKIKLKNGNIYPITNLSIEFDELFEMTRIKNRQLNILNTFRLI